LPSPLVTAVIAHFDCAFAGPNGSYPAVLEAIQALTATEAIRKPALERHSIWEIKESTLSKLP
jgi:hypothetical protein